MTQDEYRLQQRVETRLRKMRRAGKIHDGYVWWKEDNHFEPELRRGMMVAVQFWPNTTWENYKPKHFLRHT